MFVAIHTILPLTQVNLTLACFWKVVTCLELIVATSPTQPEPFIASGCGDGEVKIWRPNGEFAASCPHQGANNFF